MLPAGYHYGLYYKIKLGLNSRLTFHPYATVSMFLLLYVPVSLEGLLTNNHLKTIVRNPVKLFCLLPAETQLGHTIANIGALVGGIFAPHHVAESNEQDSEVSGPDSTVDDDNIISLTVSCISPLLSQWISYRKLPNSSGGFTPCYLASKFGNP